MNFSLGELQTSILNAIERLMAVFDDDYWLVITTQKGLPRFEAWDPRGNHYDVENRLRYSPSGRFLLTILVKVF